MKMKMIQHLALLLVGVKGERTMPYPMLPSPRHIASIIVPITEMHHELWQFEFVSLKNTTPMELPLSIFASRMCEELIIQHLSD